MGRQNFGGLWVRGPGSPTATSATPARTLEAKGFSIPATSAPSIGRLSQHHRPLQGRDQVGRRMDLLDRFENLAVGHPKVAEAAVIGVRHPKWEERPLLIVVLKAGQTRARTRCSAFLTARCKWWLPDDVASCEIPHTATGKILKTRSASSSRTTRCQRRPADFDRGSDQAFNHGVNAAPFPALIADQVFPHACGSSPRRKGGFFIP